MTEYGLIGFPLVHSFSKRYFTDKFERENISAVYKNFEMESVEGLMRLIAEHTDLRGFNITIPHKQAVIPLLSKMSDGVREIGACNCIKVSRSANGEVSLSGHNTDIIGFMDSIRPLLQPHHTKALVLGTGGASKAVVCGLRRLGVIPTLVSRHKSTDTLTYSDLDEQTLAEHTVIVNCTPLGTFPKVDTCPDIPYDYIGERHLLYDLVYNPEQTLFMQRGKAQGATVKNGLEMLHRQAEAGWTIWNSDND